MYDQTRVPLTYLIACNNPKFNYIFPIYNFNYSIKRNQRKIVTNNFIKLKID